MLFLALPNTPTHFQWDSKQITYLSSKNGRPISDPYFYTGLVDGEFILLQGEMNRFTHIIGTMNHT